MWYSLTLSLTENFYELRSVGVRLGDSIRHVREQTNPLCVAAWSIKAVQT